MELCAGFYRGVDEGLNGLFRGGWECDVDSADRKSMKIMLAILPHYVLANGLGILELATYPGFFSVIQKSAGAPAFCPNPIYSSTRPMNWYPRGWRQARKNEVEVGRWETVTVRCETGISKRSRVVPASRSSDSYNGILDE
jgi:hypothetical protein